MTLDGVVRDVKGLFQSKDALWDDYDSSLQIVDLCARWLNDGLREKYVTPHEARTIARGLASDVDHLIGEHPLRFREWRIVKEDAAALKKELRDSVRRTAADTWDFYESLRDLAPDGKTFAYELIPEQPERGEVVLAEPVHVPERARQVYQIARALQRPRKKSNYTPDDSAPAGTTVCTIAAFAAGLFGSYWSTALQNWYDQHTSVAKDAAASASLGLAVIAAGHVLNEYERRVRPQPQPEPAKQEPLVAPTAPHKYSPFNVRVGATLVSLCAVMSMMSGSASAYDREAAKPHKARQIVEYAHLTFADELPR